MGGGTPQCLTYSDVLCTEDLDLPDDRIVKGFVPLVKSVSGKTLQVLSHCLQWVKESNTAHRFSSESSVASGHRSDSATKPEVHDSNKNLNPTKLVILQRPATLNHQGKAIALLTLLPWLHPV